MAIRESRQLQEAGLNSMTDRKAPYAHPPISIVRSPSVNLIAAIDAAGPRPTKPDKLTTGTYSWREIAHSTVSTFDMADLDLVFAPLTTSIFLFYAAIEENHHEIPELIEFIKASSTEEFIDGFRKVLNIDASVPDWIDADTIEKALEVDRDRENTPFKQEAKQLEQLLKAGETFREKIVQILTWFYERVFKPEADAIMDQIDHWIDAYETPLIQDPKTMLDRLLNDIYDSVLSVASEIKLFPIADNNSSEKWLMIPEAAYSVFGVEYAQQLLPADDATQANEERTDELIEALSDPKRVALLRLLRKRPHFGREIADKLGIGASTTSYHIDRLVAAHLIKLDLSKGRRFYYAINTKGFLDLLQRLRGEFVKEGEDEKYDYKESPS